MGFSWRLPAISLVVLAIVSARVSIAQPATYTAHSLSIRALVESALALRPEFQSLNTQIDALAARRESASSWTSQPFSVETSYRSDRHYNDQGLREIELGVSAPLWNWNERSRTQSLRDSELQTAHTRFEAFKVELAGEVRQVVWDTLAAQVDVDIAQERSASAAKRVEDVSRRVDAGELARTDLYQTLAWQANTQSQVARASARLSELEIRFSELTGLPASVLQGIQPESSEIPADLHQPDHPVLKLARAELHTLEQQAELTRSQKRANPEVGVALISERAAQGASSEKSLVLSTRIPLANSAEYRSRVLDLQARLLAARASIHRMERGLQGTEQAAKNNMDQFEKLRETATEQAVMARRIHGLYLKSFELGETDLPTLLNLEQQAFEAERLARKSEIEYAAKVSAYWQSLGLWPR